MLSHFCGPDVEQSIRQDSLGEGLERGELGQLAPLSLVGLVAQFLDRRRRGFLRLNHEAPDKRRVGGHLGGLDRFSEGARGEVEQQLFHISLLYRPGSVEGRVALRWPGFDERLHRQAVDSNVGSLVSGFEQGLRHLDGPGVEDLLIHLLTVRLRTPGLGKVLLDQPFGPETPVVEAVFPAEPGGPGVIEPGLEAEGSFFSISWKRPQGEVGGGRPRDSAIGGVGHVEAQHEGLVLVGLDELTPGMSLVVA